MAVDATLRTRIGAELAGIQEQLDRSRLQDPLTESIRTWHRDFCQQFRACDRNQEILDVFIARMQSLLHSPMGGTPLDQTRILSGALLDEGSVLGTDRNTYGEKVLKLYLQRIAESDRFRFPFEPDNPSDFTVVTHSVAQHMVRWLDGHGCRDRNLEQERLYDSLQDQAELPSLPTARMVRAFRYAQRIAEQQRLAEETEMARLEEQLSRFREENLAVAREQLAPLQQQIEQNEIERHERVQQIWDERAQFYDRNQSQIQGLHHRLDIVEQDYTSLDRQIQDNEVKMHDLEKSQFDLKRSIEAACRPQTKRKHRTGKMVAGVTLAAFGNFSIPF